MNIGIHTGSAFSDKRTGVEEYAYQLIKNLVMLDESRAHNFFLYSRPVENTADIHLPNNFHIKQLKSPFLWTKFRLSLEIFLHKPDVLFVPSNFLPWIYPKKTVVTIHGVEYEHCPYAYSKFQLYYLRHGTKSALKNAYKIIAISENTKDNLIKFYGADPNKIHVICHGVNPQIIRQRKYPPFDEKYILYIGRIEKKKNIENIVKAFSIFKDQYKMPYKLVLVGGEGHGFSDIKSLIDGSPWKNDIMQTGYISVEEKDSFFRHADMFLFPSFYEGFGMPVLEAQLREVPVITSNISALPEIAGEGALFVDPNNPEEIAKNIYKIASDQELRKSLIEKGILNSRKYSWTKCAKETLNFLTTI